ncbi:phospholipase D family protein [Halpernia sp.]|uniref:phospholipase D family protein n=1 Tax=Halpernia sp. TaxID=2782209 RepID=UPI003A949F7F
MKIVKLQSHLVPEIRKAKEVFIATAIISEKGLETILNNIDTECKLKLIIGIDLPTPVVVFKKILELKNENIIAKVFLKPTYFHPKLYLTNGENKTVFVGSGNCTRGGLENHIELFHKVSNEKDYLEYVTWFNTYFNLSSEITEEWLTEYEKLYDNRELIENLDRNKVSAFKKRISSTKETIDLETIDFTNQFFKSTHYKAFEIHKLKSRIPEHDDERLEVKKKLEELHEILLPLIRNNNWDLFPHHMNTHIVSSHKHGEFTGEDLGALWLHYGKSEKELSKFKELYGENQTSMYQMRLQVLVHLEEVSIWLRVGKNNGSVVDRDSFKQKLKQVSYQNIFYSLMGNLDKNFFIQINKEKRYVGSFNNASELYEFVKNDNVTNYFIIGREFLPCSEDISIDNIAETVIKNFEILYPIYNLIKTEI